jgi:hypothetical protein
MADQMNQIKIAWDGVGHPLVVHLWDDQGVKHNISSIFTSASGVTSKISDEQALITSNIVLHKKNDGLKINFEFIPGSRSIVMDLPPDVTSQINHLLDS